MLHSLAVLAVALVTQFNTGYSLLINEFERTHGCQQYNTDSGYFTAHPYFDTSKFKNIKTDEKGVTRLRFGVLGKHNAYVRFSSVSTNSMTPMTEIALAHWWNTRSDVQKYTKTIPTGLNSNNLAQFIMKGLMSIFKPVMITLEIHPGGHVTVTKDGEFAPFLDFYDPSFSYAYMGICKWDDPVVLFYDCPLLKADGSVPNCENCQKMVKEHQSWLNMVSQQMNSCDINQQPV